MLYMYIHQVDMMVGDNGGGEFGRMCVRSNFRFNSGKTDGCIIYRRWLRPDSLNQRRSLVKFI